MERKFHSDGSLPQGREIFVFGSNEAGRHGAGAAKAAHRLYGAVYGVADGLVGRCYGIPTKDYNLLLLDLNEIGRNVKEFVDFTYAHPELEFFVTSVGCGLAGYMVRQIAPMFRHAQHCSFPDHWRLYLD